MAEKPIYGTIVWKGGSWNVVFEYQKSKTGSITTSSTSGYGEFPFEKYPDIPVINFNSVDLTTALSIANTPDNLRPAKQRPEFSGTLETWLDTVRESGIEIIEQEKK